MLTLALQAFNAKKRPGLPSCPALAWFLSVLISDIYALMYKCMSLSSCPHWSRTQQWISVLARLRPSRWTMPHTCRSVTRSLATSVWMGRTAQASSAALRIVARGHGVTVVCTSASPKSTRTRVSSSPLPSASSILSTGCHTCTCERHLHPCSAILVIQRNTKHTKHKSYSTVLIL